MCTAWKHNFLSHNRPARPLTFPPLYTISISFNISISQVDARREIGPKVPITKSHVGEFLHYEMHLTLIADYWRTWVKHHSEMYLDTPCICASVLYFPLLVPHFIVVPQLSCDWLLCLHRGVAKRGLLFLTHSSSYSTQQWKWEVQKCSFFTRQFVEKKKNQRSMLVLPLPIL